MRRLMLLAGVAALSVSLPAIAKNEDRGRGGGQQAAERGHGGGHGRAERGRGGDDQPRVRSNRGRGGDDGPRVANNRRGGDDRGRAERRGRGNDSRQAVANRGRGNDDRVERRPNRDQRRIERALREERQTIREARRQQRPDQRLVSESRSERRDWRDWSERRLTVADRFRDDLQQRRDRFSRGLAVGTDGCPPGLARQNAFCMPPGQLRKAQLIGQRLSIANHAYNVPDRYSYRFVDNDDWFYRYDDSGYVYRFDRDSGLVNSIVPLFASDLMVGEPLPLGYEVYNLPLAYRPMYQDDSDYLYRYDDGAIYQVDSDSMLIEGIVALLTGGVGGLGGLGIGDTLPSGYDVYNVPFDYRDQYVDGDDSWYRYADGSIYEVDPETRLIQQVISLLV